MVPLKRVFCGAARRLAPALLPGRCQLPFRYWLHRLEGSCEPELVHLHRLCRRRDVAVDAGANEGLFSYRLSKLFRKVYAFEVNDDLTRGLMLYNPGNIEIIHEGLSSRQQSATLYIPVREGRPLTGWASLARGNCPDASEHIEKSVVVRPLDSLELPLVSFVKIDVEGHEMEVLTGAARTIERGRPVVLAEVKVGNRPGVFAFFDERGYRRLVLADVTGVQGSEENVLFVPREEA
jgi:FkbM family methyltransferase